MGTSFGSRLTVCCNIGGHLEEIVPPDCESRAERIVQAALNMGLEERSAYLASACGDDPNLTREVETLLTTATRGESTMTVAGSRAGLAAISRGLEIEHYRIESKLGEGGMGAVYRALDTKLNRPVAVKFLAEDLADVAARRRFQREAQMASSLNHPHIVTVFSAGEFEGRQYLVTEFVDGGTLKEWAAQQARTPKQIVELMTGVADGLAAAHQAGICHRDVKPANILVAKAGYAKLADFGLAKLEAGLDSSDADRTITMGSTRPGVILGTIAYMSPEQASGAKLDPRSDIFSFGVVLYELLAGRRPFTGASDLELLKTIIHGDPAPLGAEIPAPVRAVIEKALEKDPADRYQSMREMVVDLKRIVRRAPQDDAPTALVQTGGKTRSNKWAMAAACLVGAVATAAAMWLSGGVSRAPLNPLAEARFTPFTDWEGNEKEAAISRDGRFVAFRADKDGQEDTWVSQVGSGHFINLTHGEQPVILVRNEGFTPDGSEVWLSSSINGVHFRAVPLTGGGFRSFLNEHTMDPDWSPDGSRVVYQTYDAGDPVIVADADGENPKQIYSRGPGTHNHFPTWSRDAQWIYFVTGAWVTREMDIWRIRSSGGTPERLTNIGRDIRHLTFIDAKTLLYVAPDENGAGPWLWAFDTNRKASRRVSFGLEVYSSVEASGDGRRLAATRSNPTANLWSFPILDRPAEERDVKRVELPVVRAFAPRFGGTSMFFLSSSGGGDGLWRYENGNGQPVEIWKGAGGPLQEPAAVSADGKHVAIIVRKNGKRTVYTLSADGGDVRPVGEAIDVTSTPAWSPDGQSIVATGDDGTGEGLFKIAVSGGAPIRLTKGTASNPVWSPDGSVIVYTGPFVGSIGILHMIRPDGSPVDMEEIQVRVGGERYRFIPGRQQLVYLAGPVLSKGSFWMYDLATKRKTQLSSFDGLATRTFDIAPDGKEIVFDRVRENGNIVLIDLPKPAGK